MCMSLFPLRMDKVQSKNEEARVFTTLYIDFQTPKGRLLRNLLWEIVEIFNSSKLLCKASLPARMKKIQLKMKALECSQDFSHYKPIGIFQTLKGS